MTDRWLFSVLFIAGLGSVAIALFGLYFNDLPIGKWLNTASGLLGLAAIFQARVSGWFDKILEVYGDQEKFPYGPPSHVTRQIIDDPDRPIRTWLRNIFLFEARTALWIGVVSIILATLSAWL